MVVHEMEKGFLKVVLGICDQALALFPLLPALGYGRPPKRQAKTTANVGGPRNRKCSGLVGSQMLSADRLLLLALRWETSDRWR